MIDDKLASLLVRWEEAWDLGDDVAAADLCADCPELTGRLSEQIKVLKRMAWMKKDASEDLTAEDVESDDRLVGETLAGRYYIQQLIGEGGFGRVYRAFDPDLQRPVAAKVSKPPSTNAEQADSLLEEARRVAKLRHPGIVSVHDVGRHGEQVFFVTDLIEGQSLAETIESDALDAVHVANLVAEIADALQFAHDHGFIHRDIKPANILVDSSGRPLIADFGIAASLEQVTSEGVNSGTLAYMAPEQIAGEIQLIDARTDIHALGVVMFELLTGQLPYSARTPTALREQILLRQPKSPRAINETIPQKLERICLRAIAKHPADRFGSANELATAVRSASRDRKWLRPWRWVLICCTMLFFAVSATMAVLEWNSQQVEKSSQFDGSVPTEAVLNFDGTNRIITPVQAFLPCTLEAWVRTHDLTADTFVIGSDIPGEFGIGFGVKAGYANVETVRGGFLSNELIANGQWHHLAVVYGESSTILFVDGKKIQEGPPSASHGSTPFVIGNVGLDHNRMYFRGQIRSLQISNGDRYSMQFVPEENLKADNATVLSYTGLSTDANRVIDLSGNGNDGTWERRFP